MTGSPCRRQVWTQEQLDRAAALHQDGWSEHRIAIELGLSRSTTRRLLVRVGRVAAVTDETSDDHRDSLLLIVRNLERGFSLKQAADAAQVDLQAARGLIRSAPTLVPWPTTAHLNEAEKVRQVLVGTDVRGAAEELGIDPWWALFLLLTTGSENLSMQRQRQPEAVQRAEQMKARKAEGATFEQIGTEFGLTHERVRRILIATGGWTPPARRGVAGPARTTRAGA